MFRPMQNRRAALSPAVLVCAGMAIALGIVALLLWMPRTSQTTQGELTLYCAAGLLKPVEQVAADYQRECGVRVRLEPGGSGTLLSKLRVAPERVDLFLAAEESYLREARQQKLVAEALPVARQHVVVAVQPGNPRKIAAAADLLAADVKVAIPNAELAAVGRAARRALTAAGEWERLMARTKDPSAKVSLVGTVNEAAQAVKLGAVDAALVWDATARQFGVEFVEPAEFRDKTTELVMVGVVAAGPRPTAALHFARYLTARDRGEKAFQQHFLQPPDDADAWADRPELTLMSGAMLKPAVEKLLKRFEQREGVSINTIYAGCGIHVAQMKAMKSGQVASAHFPDAYFACDVSFMDQVQQWFEASRRISRNDIVLAVAKGNPHKVKSIEDLARLELRVGLAHPVNSALGALTDDLLKQLKLHERVYAPSRKTPVVHTDAGHMLVNQLRTGSLDVVVVYRSNVLSNKENAEKYIEAVEMNLPQAVAVQPYAVGVESQHRHLMRRLLETILTPDTKQGFLDAGFTWVADEVSR